MQATTTTTKQNILRSPLSFCQYLFWEKAAKRSTSLANERHTNKKNKCSDDSHLTAKLAKKVLVLSLHPFAAITTSKVVPACLLDTI